MMFDGTGSMSTSSRRTKRAAVLVTTPLIEAAEYLAHFVTHGGRPTSAASGAWTDDGMWGGYPRRSRRTDLEALSRRLGEPLPGWWRVGRRRWGRMAPEHPMPEGR